MIYNLAEIQLLGRICWIVSKPAAFRVWENFQVKYRLNFFFLSIAVIISLEKHVGGIIMKKLVFLTMVFILAISSVGMCAVPDPNAGFADVQVGYNYYDLQKSSGSTDLNKMGFNEVSGSVGIGLGFGAFVNYAQASTSSYTDFGIKSSMLIPNVALMAGQRRMATDNAPSDNNLFVGAEIKQELIDGIGVYGTYQKGTDFRDEVLGVTYSMGKNAEFNVNWKNYDDNNGMTFKGLGGGLNIKF